MPKKKVGIVADQHKVEKFKKELTDAGFTDFKVELFNRQFKTYAITVQVEYNQVPQIADICRKVEFYYKNRN